VRRVWIEKREANKGFSYYVRWYDVNGKQQCVAAGHIRSVAEEKASQIYREMNSPGYKAPVKVKLMDFIAEHLKLANAELTAGSVVSQRVILGRFLEWCKGGAPKTGERRNIEYLDQVTPLNVEKFRANLRHNGLAPATVNKYVRTLKCVLQKAVSRNYLKANPLEEIRHLKEPEVTHRTLSVHEIEKILAACPNLRWSAFLMLALTTGMRKGELQFLEWSDIDFERGVVNVRCKDDHRTKNARNRVVPLRREAAEMLIGLRHQTTGRWVFQSRNGTQWRCNLNLMLKRLLKRAGVAHCTFHDMRRTVASELQKQGYSVEVARRLLGHSSVVTTQRWYTEVGDEVVKKAVGDLPYLQQFGVTKISPSRQIFEFKTKTA
jgi:integrase